MITQEDIAIRDIISFDQEGNPQVERNGEVISVQLEQIYTVFKQDGDIIRREEGGLAMPQREGPPPEIYIKPAGEGLWTVSWHFLETPWKRSEARDTQEAVRVDVAYRIVWGLLINGFSLHNTDHYDELEDATLRFFEGNRHSLETIQREVHERKQFLEKQKEEGEN